MLSSLPSANGEVPQVISSSKVLNTSELTLLIRYFRRCLPLLSLGGYTRGLLLVGSVPLNSKTNENKILEYHGLFPYHSVAWNVHKMSSEPGGREP